MTEPEINFSDRKQLRDELRARRHALTPMQQQQAALGVLRQLMKLPVFMRSHHVALYVAADGEIDPSPIAQQLWKMNKHCYLPVLHPIKPRLLWFVRYTADTPLKPNRSGIPGPDPIQNHQLPAHLLATAVVPLLGFDRCGGRLGLGAAVYYCTFKCRQQKQKGRPYLLGLARACQEVEKLASAS